MAEIVTCRSGNAPQAPILNLVRLWHIYPPWAGGIFEACEAGNFECPS